ncbi:MAG: DNA polymerase III subunit alpha [Luteibacter sp.]|uniref:DNA polymerase III subunit alpha n=1 Tax=Luteibacter sp. TaxID=1886636 RepID=UPI00137EC73F|nr:DNA polymerase III subunit alpha [Luteibacter sp.]KAF1009642.1 MAG: DNA polymerase III subunit alpha [Luteibacter sp.]
MSVRFAHLHLHSEYSLVDSTIRIKQLIAACVRAGMPAVALTDESNMFGLVKFYKQCAAAGIKPIGGCDIWVSSPDDPRPWRLTLICQNRDGYLNLSRLVSRAWREGQGTGRALVDAAWITPDSVHGLIAIAGRESEVGRAALGAGLQAASARLSFLRRLFPERLYLELTRTGRDNEENWIRAAMALAGEHMLPVIASNDVRFIERAGFESHEARTCINQGRVLADPKRPRDYSEEQYFKSSEDMEALFADIPEALENTIELAKRCNLELEFGTYYLPNFPVPEGHNLDTFIREQAQKGLEERLEANPLAAGKTREDYQARLDREVDVIIRMGFPGYFLIVADFINWGKQNGIPVGPGRGSGAGSLVAWVLKITDLDPLQFELLFERFLNPERVSMPDFDIDFCMDRRDEVIDYVSRKYGRDHVSQIITYGSMAAKAVLRDSGRVLGMGYGQVDRIAKLIPARPLDLTLSCALGRSEKAKKEPERIVKDFCDLYENEEESRTLIDLALSLEGLTRNAGKHAGGVVIAPTPLTDFAPLYCEPSGEGVVTQYDKDDVEAVGLVKFDFLGLRTLTIIDWAVKAINRRRETTGEEPLVIETLPLDDPKVYDLLKKAQTVAVFQLESRGMQGMLKDAQADRFEDIIALVALYRPGPMDLIPSFCARKHGKEAVEYPDPRVEPILKETYGIMVYQEQVMQMAQIVGGYTLGGADLLRRAMGKKKAEEMVKHRATFREGAAKDGIDGEKADAIFDLMEKFAGYGFNKSHAAAYALVSYQTAWLKAHYPAEFMAATISSDMDNTEKVVTFLDETRAIGIKVLPPDVNASEWMFEAVESRVVRYGLGAIKGVGQGICEEIAAERKARGPFKGLVDFCQRIGSNKLNKRVMEALVQSGALDALGENRATLVMHIPEAMRAADQEAKNRVSGQVDIFGSAFGDAEAPSIIELSGSMPEWPLEQLLQGEHTTLGHYLSGHPTDPWKAELGQLSSCPIGEIPQRYQPPRPRRNDDDEGASRFRRGPETPWTVAGMVVGMRKRGDSDAFVQIEDSTGLLETSFFREVFTDAAPLLTRGNMIVIEGGLRIDDFAGGYQLRARKAYSLSDAMEHFGRLLTLKLNGVDPDFPKHLKQALMGYRGGRTPLLLAGYRNEVGQASMELGDAWRVRALPDLVRTLRTLPGVLGTELRLVRPSD